MSFIKAPRYNLLFIAIFLCACTSSENNVVEKGHNHLSKYELIKDWPLLPKTFPYSHVSAVGVDTNQNIFILQRTGRVWGDSLPDSLITLPTIFELDKGTGKILNSWGANQFIMPHGLSIDEENNVWITDVALNQVFKFDHSGKLLLKIGEAKIAGNDSLHFNRPTDVAIAKDGSFYVSDGYRNSRVVKFSKDGKYLFEWGKKGTGQSEFDIPHAVCLDSHGNVFVADRENNRIQEFDMNGVFIKEWKNDQAKVLYSLAIDKADNVFAVDDIYVKDSLPMGDDIIQLNSKFDIITRFGRSDMTGDTSDLFHDIAVDKKGNIFAANILERKVQKFSTVSNK